MVWQHVPRVMLWEDATALAILLDFHRVYAGGAAPDEALHAPILADALPPRDFMADLLAAQTARGPKAGRRGLPDRATGPETRLAGAPPPQLLAYVEHHYGPMAHNAIFLTRLVRLVWIEWPLPEGN